MTDHIFPPWRLDQWKAVDDRVRGGASTSHLDTVENLGRASSSRARFWGHLDIDTLGGAGFASQRFVFGPEPLHLPRHLFKGITIDIVDSGSSLRKSSVHTYTLVLKTSLSNRTQPPNVPPSPEPASLSYEASFTVGEPSSLGSKTRSIHLNINDFIATYRGRELPRSDPRYQPFHSEKIYELSLMCRSGFGEQKGDFELVIQGISRWRKESKSKAIVSFFSSIWNRATRWILSWFSTEGKVQLQDEEKQGLLE
ncbi:complex I intermediate-associated protein 30-domain-containing protein [Kockovaella imperatae]|uniref:Complex I intermediate-associated protein 30-domain-containing protein n=1 Tax=Kockovaella imperatae TaxID=4999 RepID=A0A1Y1U849_9TREE|nr:complex I intermediate-associated protein 30-domain-containing protein [Kockovaella imperatae]ORX34209.1 complex I intermediate-associated protein 30-domain-containing protein [Kockovaella imperatae]